ncbi:MAG: putative cell wall binding protein [Clostridia bacterium]|jgi:pilus assembly protein CpaB|nr:putative cell wall binding protein [Clostridia bacterium]
MENINKKIALIAIAAALITSFLIYLYLSGVDSTSNTAKTKVAYVAAEDIAAKVVITDKMITQVKVPLDITLPIGVSDKNEILGKMTKERIVKGEPILIERLFEEKMTTMPYVIPKGKRAVTISVNEISQVSTFMTPGDFVDVIVTYEERDKEIAGRNYYYPKYTKVIMQNVQVLGIGRNMQEVNKTEGELATSVTLALSLIDAEKLIISEESGTLRLVLRPAMDDAITTTPGAIRDDLMTPKSKVEF